MSMQPVNPYAEYEKDIQDAYEGGVTKEDAEKFAAKFLTAQLKVGAELAKVDLDARMKKSGSKAAKGGVYLEEAARGDKKPTEATLSALVDKSKLVRDAQDALDRAEVKREELQNYLNVFREAHIFFRKLMGDTYSG